MEALPLERVWLEGFFVVEQQIFPLQRRTSPQIHRQGVDGPNTSGRTKCSSRRRSLASTFSPSHYPYTVYPILLIDVGARTAL
jgi:hypothetical protein